MTKDELITNQQLEIEEMRQMLKDNHEWVTRIKGRFYNIGAPLNDNILKFNSDQIRWALSVTELIEQINFIEQ